MTGLLTHGFVYAGINLDRMRPITSYQGFFQHMILLIEAFWSKAHGWEPMSHIDSFGRWFADAVHFGCPTIGLIAFCLISRSRIGRTWWKPVMVAAAFTAMANVLLAYGPKAPAEWIA